MYAITAFTSDLCRLPAAGYLTDKLAAALIFFSKTADELSLVCPEADLPAAVLQCERGWRALKICGTLDFGLVGILAKISGLLAEAGISIFAVSTYNTDYILIKAAHLDKAVTALSTNGYQITV